ncbi:hypothetical protein FOZG_18353 [Fusarium oxysporum Fo47]|uniref:alpha-L-rhamnosidase n=1 Tax=Fusarium oxysporum Fo47 TaxID=660027 RepID=W9J7C3_FUSOX|nr:hypothetical protein FOZG_18353 [Fusarium oxysporum Fo47]
MSSPHVGQLKFEHHHSGLGLDTPKPRLSWIFGTSPSTASAWAQTCYEVEVTFARTEKAENFQVSSDQSVLIPWPARPLSSRESATVRVRVRGKSLQDEPCTTEYSPWSAPATVEAALLEPSDYKANFITSAKRLGPFRLVYRIHNVSSLLLPGEKNIISVEVAEGWYAGRLGFKGGERFRYGDELGLFAQLEVQDDDAAVSWHLCSDDSWLCTSSPIINSEIYDGETYDMNHTDSDTLITRTLSRPTAQIVAPDIPPVRVIETKPFKKIFSSKSGNVILDFGQNLVGKLYIPRLETEKGKHISFRHAEVMEDGELGTYVEVEGWPGDGPSIDDIQALVLHTDMRRRGFFECSNPYVNRLHQNVVWSMRGNFLSLPTDCPQRDERLGWTGDLQVFCPTATYLYDTLGILGNWLQDLSAEQLEEGKGGIPRLVCPLAISSNWPHIAQAVWDDVTVLTPDVLYQYSSDKNLLERQFESMQTWLDQGVDRAPNGLWNPDKWQLADWLDPSAPPDDPGNRRTDNILVANAYLVHTTLVLAKLCMVLGKTGLGLKYGEDGERTGINLAVRFGLYPEKKEQRETARKALDPMVRVARFHISIGFAGTPAISHALTEVGRSQLAYRMLLETACPSWLYAVVSHDATTVWER